MKRLANRILRADIGNVHNNSPIKKSKLSVDNTFIPNSHPEVIGEESLSKVYG